MKLLQRTGFYFLGFSLLTLLLGGTGMFFVLNYMLDEDMDESMQKTRPILLKELSQKDSLPSKLIIMDEVITLQPMPGHHPLEIFKDTMWQVKEAGEDELETAYFRQYIYGEKINGKNYRISLHQPKFEKENLQVTIMGLIIIFLIVALLLINLFNRYMSRRIWQPFYHTIRQIKDYTVASPQVLSSLPTDIDEFKTLDHALSQMMEKTQKDYRALKQFTENASHEIQTPLAIIRSQIELMLQQERDDENELQHLHQIQKAASRLSKLNQALLLLTRIENRQYTKLEPVDLKKAITEKIFALDILTSAKSLEVTTELEPVEQMMHPDLTDILISNLLSNAIKHNFPKGKINILLSPEKLIVRNTGIPLAQPPTELFGRFRKADGAGKSIGLGLAIVKEICDVYHWDIKYENDGEWHEVSIKF